MKKKKRIPSKFDDEKIERAMILIGTASAALGGYFVADRILSRQSFVGWIRGK